MKTATLHLRAIMFAVIGFTLWVLADTCMKLAGEAKLPSYEVVGFLGLFGTSYLLLWHAPQKKIRELWPKKPSMQLLRALMAFGCVMANTFALNHLPLTLFYITVFTSPMLIAIVAALFLREHLSWKTIAAIVVGFGGVVIAVEPWNNFGGGDAIGYTAVACTVVFYAVATIVSRMSAQHESSTSIVFFTAAVEGTLGFALMLINGTPISWSTLPILAVMAAFNVTGNMYNFLSLRHINAATVEHYHYTQLIAGALLGYAIWHEVPTVAMLIGAAVIVVSGLYVAASAHLAEKLKSSEFLAH